MMAARDTHGFCPECKQETAIDHERRCLWCETVTVPLKPKPRKRGGGKPKGKWGKMSDEQVRAAHVLYMRHNLSCYELARRGLTAKFGYSSDKACANSLYHQFKRLNLTMRSQREVTIARNLKHGHATRAQKATNAGERAYRQWRKEELGWNSLQGPGQQQCEGVRTNPPGKGKRCEHHAAPGSKFCHSHDPEREAERQAHLARVRARLPQLQMVPIGPWADWVETEAKRRGSQKAVAQLLGCSDGTVSNWIRRLGTRHSYREPITEISREALDRYLGQPGVPTYEDLYPTAIKEAA